jgi:hypothetical protein
LNAKDAGLALLAVEHLQLGKVPTESSVLTSAGKLSVLLCAAQSEPDESVSISIERDAVNVLLLHEAARSANSV